MNCPRCGKWAGAYAGIPSAHDLCVCPKPKKEWQGLTAKDLAEIPANCYEGAIWADAKLKEKNSATD